MKKIMKQEKPETNSELCEIIQAELRKQGPDADLNFIDTSGITDMRTLFYNLGSPVRNIKIDKWETSNVERMSRMFLYCSEFNADLSGWNTSKVTDMVSMFNGCTEFNSDISGWDVSKVTDMYMMFYGCHEFESDLSKWNVSKVKDMNSMFEECTKFNSDLSGWDVSRVENVSDMFRGCSSFDFECIRDWVWPIPQEIYERLKLKG